jgi:nucleotide-binding universal stress UspA family protein
MPAEPVGPVVVGVDGSKAAMEAVDLAAEEAAGRVTPLVVVHVRDPRTDGVDAGARPLGVALSRARAEHPALSAAAVQDVGDPTDLLVARAWQASLLVVGHNGRCASGGLRADSVAHRLIGQTSVPILVHRPLATEGAPPLPRPVLVGVASAPGDDAVLEFAFAEADLRGAPLRALYVWRAGVAHDDEPALSGFTLAWEEAGRLLEQALLPWSEKYPEVPVTTVLRHGIDVSVAMSAASRCAQLVVVGSPARHGARPTPSVAQILVHRAGCSVAVVPVD